MSKNRNRHGKTQKSSLMQTINQQRFPKAFQIGEPNHNLESISNEIQIIRELISSIEHQAKSTVEKREKSEVASQEIITMLKLFADVTTGIWRTKLKMLQPGTDQPYEEMRKAYRPLAATFDLLCQAGLEIKDWTDAPYATGMIEKVVAFEPSPTVVRETVLETIKPTILYKEQLLQKGEIIVGVPEQPNSGQQTLVN